MHLARTILRIVFFVAAISALAFARSGTARADRVPLLGSGTTAHGSTTHGVAPLGAGIVPVDPSSVPCDLIATFSDVLGGANPGTNYDGLILSGGMLFAERFAGQSVTFSGDFDVVSGTPLGPLTPQLGAPGQNLDVFAYTGNVLAGLGHLGYPDLDAIGEGSIAMYFPSPQSRVSFEIVGGNGGSATLSFYRADGSLIDDVVVSGLADLDYGFATSEGTPAISGILVQNTDPSGIGVVNICHDGGIVNARVMSWSSIKKLYR